MAQIIFGTEIFLPLRVETMTSLENLHLNTEHRSLGISSSRNETCNPRSS